MCGDASVVVVVVAAVAFAAFQLLALLCLILFVSEPALCVRVCVVICCCLQFLSPKSLSTTSLSFAALCNIIKQPRP